MATVHIIGAGLAGLSCAVSLAQKRLDVRLYEAAPQAGGRCRSYRDDTLGHVIDNGNHLLLSANRATLGYLRTIAAENRLTGPSRALMPFLDLDTLTPWQLDFGDSRFPWWILQRRRRVPGTFVSDYLALRNLMRESGPPALKDRAPTSGPIFDRFLEPMVIAVMNEGVDTAAAAPFARVLRETLLAGGSACRPLIATENLADTFIEPALAYLARHGAAVQFGRRVRSLEIADDMVKSIHFTADAIDLGAGDCVVLATPSPVAASLLPGLAVPDGDSPILNVHFSVPTAGLDALFAGAPLLGLVNGIAHWVFRRENLLSVTVSAADPLIDEPAEILARLIWQDLARAFARPARPVPPYRVIKEKRATFRQTPENEARRPGFRTRCANLFLAGDWTATGIPATIEGAVRSGATAAAASLTFADGHGVAAARVSA